MPDKEIPPGDPDRELDDTDLDQVTGGNKSLVSKPKPEPVAPVSRLMEEEGIFF